MFGTADEVTDHLPGHGDCDVKYGPVCNCRFSSVNNITTVWSYIVYQFLLSSAANEITDRLPGHRDYDINMENPGCSCRF